MEQWKKSLAFWLMIVVSIVLPSVANAQVKIKKTSWKAPITVGTTQVGTAQIIRKVTCTIDNSTGACGNLTIDFTYTVITNTCSLSSPCQDPYPVTKASVTGSTWQRVLCESDTCEYNEDTGNLDLLNAPFPTPPPSLGDELDRGMVQLLLNDGSMGVGTFVKHLNVVQ